MYVDITGRPHEHMNVNTIHWTYNEFFIRHTCLVSRMYVVFIPT